MLLRLPSQGLLDSIDADAMSIYLDRKRRTRVEEKEGKVAVSFKSGKRHYVVCTTTQPYMVKHNAKLSMLFYRAPNIHTHILFHVFFQSFLNNKVIVIETQCL